MKPRSDRPPVMVIEDDPDLRSALVEVLHGYDVDTLEADNGRDALTKLRTGPRPGLILLDLTMPTMSGWEFRAIQRHEPALADIPVVIVSATVDGFGSSCLDAVGYLPKPLGLEALQSLAALLAQHCARV